MLVGHRRRRILRAAAASCCRLLVLLPAFGLAYAVGVARVLGPRVVLRRSLQYALANRTLPRSSRPAGDRAGLSLVQDATARSAEIVTSSVGALPRCSSSRRRWRCATASARASGSTSASSARSTTRGRSCCRSPSRVRFETDPADLATMVVDQIDEALHPEMTAMLVSGIEEGRLVAGHRAARQRRAAAARRRAGRDAAVVRRPAGDRAERSALAGPPAAAGGAASGWSARARSLLVPVLGAGSRRSSRVIVARRAAIGRGVHRRGPGAAREHRGADGARLRRRAAAPARRPRHRRTTRPHARHQRRDAAGRRR